MSHPKCVVGSELGCFARAVSTLGRLSLLARPLKEEFFFKVTEEMKTSCCVLSASWDIPIGWWPQHLSTGHPVADNGIPMPLPSCFLPCSHSVVSTPERQLLGEAFMTLTVLSLTGDSMVPSVTLCEHGLQVHWHSLFLFFYVVYIILIQSAEFPFSVSRTHHRYSAIPPLLPPFWLNQKLRSKKTKNCHPMACMEQGYLSLIFKYYSWPLNYVRVTFI